MFGAPSIVAAVASGLLIALVPYVQCLQEAVGGLSIAHRARGVKIIFPLSKASLPHPVLFYRTQKIVKIGNLSRLCQIGALLQPFSMIYVTFLVDSR